MGRVWVAVLVAVALMLSPPATAETWEAVALGDPGLTLGGVTTVYTTDGAADTLPGGVALVDHGNGVYSVTGLPDVNAGSGTVHSLTLIYSGSTHVYTWPLTTKTPSQVVAPLFHTLPTSQVELAVGATGPDPLLIQRNLQADPTGAAVTFALYSRSGAAVTLAGTASLESVEAASNNTWTATLKYEWDAADTAAACSGCWGRFTMTLPGGEILKVPPAPQTLGVTIYE